MWIEKNLSFLTAIEAWSQALGAKKVTVSDETLSYYARSTANYELKPKAVLYPSSTAEVQQIVQIASQYKIPIHAFSRGKNWGYGDACAPTPEQVIVDLSCMNKIIEVDADIGFARIEAGVSQGELYKYLQDHNLPLWMDATAAGPDASIVGNTLDRGFGHTRYGDRSLGTCGMTVVLPNGHLLKTGFTHYSNAKAGQSYRNGVGPFVDGIFFQSNLGIVTEMGFWLMPKPEFYSTFFFTAQDESGLGEIINRLGPLKRQGLLPSAIHIANDLRLISNRTHYPWAEANGVVPLPRELRFKLRKKYGVGAWVGFGSIVGPKKVVKAIEKILVRELRGFNPIFLDDQKLIQAKRLEKTLRKFGMGKALKEKILTVTPVFELLKGIPTAEAIQGAEWRVCDSKKCVTNNLLDGNAGLIWVSPILPMTAKAAHEVLEIMETLYTKYGFDTLVTFTMITDRALCAVSNIAYDRRDMADVIRAKACYDDIFDHLIDLGYIPYRTGPCGFEKLTRNSSEFWDFASTLKGAIDPENIMSPGRYIPKPNNKA